MRASRRARFYRARTIVSSFLLAFLLPGAVRRAFTGSRSCCSTSSNAGSCCSALVFWPQDFYLVVLIALTALVTLVLSTASSGGSGAAGCARRRSSWRWCSGRSSTSIEGSAEQQLRRDRGRGQGEDDPEGPQARGLLRAVVRDRERVPRLDHRRAGADRRIVTDPPTPASCRAHRDPDFSLVFYLVFARFREQACVLACPYGRVLSSLIDRRTVTVTYDSARGEPRGRISAGRRGGWRRLHRLPPVRHRLSRPGSTSATAFSWNA